MNPGGQDHSFSEGYILRFGREVSDDDHIAFVASYSPAEDSSPDSLLVSVVA